jgi:hypothetical protein
MKRLMFCMLMAGCAGTAESEVKSVVPTRAQLTMAPPAGGAAQPAMLYAVTRTTTSELNQPVGHVLDLVGKITQHPPTASGPGWAMWQVPDGRFSIDHDQYSLEQNGKAVLVGRTVRSGAGISGAFHANTETGAVEAAYEIDPAATHIRLNVMDGANAGAYVYEQLADGSGAFQFGCHADLEPGAQLEEGLVRSRWTASGAGRGDAHVHGGDAGAGMDVSECWGDDFATTSACVL